MIRRIVSGGQTGADRAALDVALLIGLECGGWVPKGRLAEDGPIAATYPDLVEADFVEPRVRTERPPLDGGGQASEARRVGESPSLAPDSGVSVSRHTSSLTLARAPPAHYSPANYGSRNPRHRLLSASA